MWFAVVVGHFLLCAAIAHRLGSPDDVPASLATLNELFSNGIAGFLSFVLAILWMAVVLVTFAALALGALFAGFLAGPRVRSAAFAGFACLLPTALVTLLTLLILPFDSHNLPADPTGLELAETMTFPLYLETLYNGLFAIVTIGVLFAGLFVSACVFFTYLDGGVFFLTLAVLIGIACALTFGFLVGPAVLRWSEAYGAVRATVGFLAIVAALTAPPTLLVMHGAGGSKRQTRPV